MTTAAPAPNDVLAKVDALGPPGTPVTTPEVAEGFDCHDEHRRSPKLFAFDRMQRWR